MNESIQNALFGALVADAVAMPVHWYYDTNALDRDYGPLEGYRAPRNPHPDSILWRSSYRPRNKMGEILHDQAQYWGKRGIHYHQFLPAGDNTLNFLLGIQLYRSTVRAGRYDPDVWLELYADLMRKSGWHKDTYIEEYHRAFFDNLAKGKALRQCGIDDLHIGGLAQVPFLIAALDALGENSVETDCEVVKSHVALTHRNQKIFSAAEAMVRILHDLKEGLDLHAAIGKNCAAWASPEQFESWKAWDDRTVVGKHLTPACYLPESFTAALAITWKYADDFDVGILANARCGGDSCHRGAVVGSLLAAANGTPENWLADLRSMARLRCDTLDPIFSD